MKALCAVDTTIQFSIDERDRLELHYDLVFVDFSKPMDAAALEAELILIHSKVPNEVLIKFANCKYIGVRAHTIDYVDSTLANELGITVAGIPQVGANAVMNSHLIDKAIGHFEKDLVLVKPSIEYHEEYTKFYEEWKRTGEDMVPWVIEKDPANFSEYISFLYSQDSEDKLFENGFVPHSTYWLVDSQQRILGAVNIRHRLNEKLFNSGGHIGYGIRPSMRRLGYASKLLAFALEKTQELGIDNVLVVCDKGNIGSERTILKNGGIFDSEFIEESGNIVKRFWINRNKGE